MITKTLGAICDEVDGVIQTGPFGSQLHQKDYVSEGIPVVMPKDIIDGRIAPLEIAKISEEDAERLSKHRLRPGEIVYGRRGDIGRQALITEKETGWLCGTGCLRIGLGDSIVDPKFLHYYLRQPSVIAWISNQAIGATMPNLNTTILRSVPITYPVLAIQREIGSLLYSYDVLIQKNNRKREIIREMIRLIYREWFTKYRFPGSDPAKLNNRHVLPTGWNQVTIADVTQYINRGISPKYANEGTQLVVNQRCIRDGTLSLEPARVHKTVVPSEKLLRVGDVLINSTGVGTLGRVAQVCEPITACTADSHVTIVRPTTEIDADFFGMTLLELESKIESLGTGSTGQTELARSAISALPILLPPKSIQEAFADIVGPMRKLSIKLATTNGCLRKTRDLLIPRLMSCDVEMPVKAPPKEPKVLDELLV